MLIDSRPKDGFIDSTTISSLGDCQAELIVGGRHGSEREDSRHGSGSCRRHRDGNQNSPVIGAFGGQSSGQFGINIYQINIAFNMIMGGTGNSILNMQGNQAA